MFQTRSDVSAFISIKDYDPDEIFHKICNGSCYSNAKMSFEGFLVKTSSVKLACLKKNRVCVSCGCVGNRMILEKHHNDPHSISPHFNLYANWSAHFGKKYAVLMTKDHIVPVSLGGCNGISNMQTMCSLCNNIKSNTALTPAQINMVRGFYDYYLSEQMRGYVLSNPENEARKIAESFVGRNFVSDNEVQDLCSKNIEVVRNYVEKNNTIVNIAKCPV